MLIVTLHRLHASKLKMSKKQKPRRFATTSGYLIESRDAERKLREARKKPRLNKAV
jgi:hypothetical protein